ncbi:HIUH-like protein [Mya arenaria]|uniref:5-hydroxyisourate hydrolase n=1 Tax=Mya arenaria TaxID=6604 RepID=A0ABY7DUU1_MYAAR|nr:5-hydroxyisourate hydrolase-like [Mya arenaria]XP_052793696.1 5-hydroxyisourate hydrolase-like [Mya arenaria]WAR00441.1 HIUH-like protein [Mya arenaria]
MSQPIVRMEVTSGHLKHPVPNRVPPLTTHILDTARGVPASNVPMLFSRQNERGDFDQIEQGTTDNDGRGGFLRGGSWQPGVYRLRFDTDAYFQQQNTTGFYPFVEVVFRITDPCQHYHVPLLLSPYGYSTYRGS